MERNNESQKGGGFMAEWISLKTNWVSTDRFNIADYNRIKNNIKWLCDKANQLYKEYEYAEMGNDIATTDSYWKVEYFNAFEKNIEEINKNILTKDYGVSQRFFENGPFIKWDELNRIENACERMKKILDNQELARTVRISFRLGNTLKGVNV